MEKKKKQRDCMTPLEFLQDFYGYDDCTVYYNVYGKHIEPYSMEEAAALLQKDLDDMIELFAEHGIAEKAKEATFSMWEKKLVRL